MMDLEKEIRGLKKPEPSGRFCRDAKVRLMHKIELYENESWFVRLLKRIGPVLPSEQFIRIAKMRLMANISAAKQPVLGWIAITKRVVASTLVMAIAVTTTLFFMGGKQPVSASENTYLEVMGGEVTLKHSDSLIWDVITTQTELAEGDVIQLGESATAVIHFFDDSELRLADGSLLLLSRLDISPGFAKQGVIEASLRQGKAWVQTLNVDDDFAKFTLFTPDAIISTQNASFDVQTGMFDPTSIRVFRRSADVSAFKKDTRDILAEGKLNSFRQITLDSTKVYKNVSRLENISPITDLEEKDRGETWVTDNLQKDRDHLAQLRERELISISAATGALPGSMLYPVKRAKERLDMALRFNEEDQADARVNMAGQRLSESIVLIEQGETEKAKEALAEYQKLVGQITSEADRSHLNIVITAHKKTLVAALPGDAQIGIVKEALDETEELLAEDPIEKAEIRLQNALDDLAHIQDFVTAGDLESAEQALGKHEALAAALLTEVTEFKDDEEKRAFLNSIMDTQYEERRILSEISRSLVEYESADDLAALIKSADQGLDSGIKLAAAAVMPYQPDVALSQVVMLPIDEKVYEFTKKVSIYKTYQGQKNQINKLFKDHPQYARDPEFLTKLSNRLDSRAKDIINVRLLQLQGELKAAQSKRVKVKIQRSKDLREDN